MSQEHVESVDLIEAETVAYLSAAVLFAALTAVLAQLSIQLPGGIPFSFQPFGVFFAGLLLGPLWGGFTLLLYFVVGLAGAPVFSNAGAGIGYVLGPTGGFLIGFVIAAVLIGAVAHRSLEPRPLDDLSTVPVVVALVASLVPIYAAGIPWFAEVQGLSLLEAVSFMTPFAVGDLLKIAITIGVVTGGNELLEQF